MENTKVRILIVDDEAVVRESLTQWFMAEGYEVWAASGGIEALRLLQDHAADLALLDIQMPGMDGIDLQARLHEADPELTVIIMTGFASVDTAVRSLKQGAWDYLTKPIDPDQLSHVVSYATLTLACMECAATTAAKVALYRASVEAIAKRPVVLQPAVVPESTLTMRIAVLPLRWVR